MKIRVNGAERTFDAALTVAALLGAIGLDRDGIAVAVDRQVVPKTEHERFVVRDGADVEVIRAVGGG